MTTENKKININLNISTGNQPSKTVEHEFEPISEEAREMLYEIDAPSRYSAEYLDLKDLNEFDRRLLLFRTMKQNKVRAIENPNCYAEASVIGFRYYGDDEILERMIYACEYPFNSPNSEFKFYYKDSFESYWTDERKSAVAEERRLPPIIGISPEEE